MSSGYRITEIFEQFGTAVKQQGHLHGEQLKVLELIRQCRTGALGSHKERCTGCGHTKVHYNSCGNRHCPNCQGVNRERWLLKRAEDLLPISYFHGVFTVPRELRSLFLYNKKILYNLLFRCVWETIQSFAMDPRQKMEAKTGMIAILHTWNQKMQYHPHLHCILPSGGIDKDGGWKTSRGKQDFLFPVQALSDKFKKKFLILLTDLYKKGALDIPDTVGLWNSPKAFYTTKRALYDKKWVVYTKASFDGATQVLEYLGRYTHRIAISNYRITKVSDTHVSFRYLDRTRQKTETLRLTGEDFVLRFLQHVLPKGFTKIRHYGFLSTRSKKLDLHNIRAVLGAVTPEKVPRLTAREVLLKTTGVDPWLCPKCKTDSMRVIEITPSIRGAPNRLCSSITPMATTLCF